MKKKRYYENENKMTKEQKATQIKKLAEKIEKLSNKKISFKEAEKPKKPVLTKEQRIQEIKKLVKLIEGKTGKKIQFKEASNLFKFQPETKAAPKAMTESEYKAKVEKLKEMYKTQTKNSPGRTQIKREMAELKKDYSKQLAESKKKVVKEAEAPIAQENKEVSILQEINQRIEQCIECVSSIRTKDEKNKSHALNSLSQLSRFVNNAIKQVTDGTIKEDVDMSIDQIEKEPDVVQKLNNKKININLVDKNQNGQTNSSTSTTSTY